MIDELQGMLVPHIHELDSVDISGVGWILVIEKEASQSVLCCSLQCPYPPQATFQSLASSKFYHNATIGNGVIVTVKLLFQKTTVRTANEI